MELKKVNIVFKDHNEFLDIVDRLDRRCSGMWYYKGSKQPNEGVIYFDDPNDVEALCAEAY